MLDGRTRYWEYRNPHQMDEDSAREWVFVAHGALAAGLPAEIRRELYGDVQMWGPAAEDVAVLLAALNRVLPPAYYKACGEVGALLMTLADGVTAGGMVLRDEVAHMLQTSRLEWTLEIFCPAMHSKDWEVYQGVSIVLWMLNGQYLFSADDVAGEGALVDQVNTILVTLGLSELQGVFVGCR